MSGHPLTVPSPLCDRFRFVTSACALIPSIDYDHEILAYREEQRKMEFDRKVSERDHGRTHQTQRVAGSGWGITTLVGAGAIPEDRALFAFVLATHLKLFRLTGAACLL